ncbi:MAG: hypothetical protein R6W92_03265 [Desulfocurvibacter africanus]
MLAILYSIILALSFVYQDLIWLKTLPILLIAIYTALLLPGTLALGLNKHDMKRTLSEQWTNGEDIAIFMYKNWASIAYPFSAQKRGQNASFIGFTSIVASLYYIYTLDYLIALSLSIIGLVLVWIGNRVNKLLFVLKHKAHPLWDVACSVAIIMSEAKPDSFFKTLIELLPKDEVARVAAVYKK